MKSLKGMFLIRLAPEFFIFLVGATLVFRDQFSTVAIILFSVSFVFLKKPVSLLSKSDLKFALIPVTLLIPRVLGLVTGDLDSAINELIRSLPYILLVLPFIVNKHMIIGREMDKRFFHGLLLGLVLFMAICNYYIIVEMIKEKEPLEYLFRWRHMNVNFTAPIGAHPPYVGMLVVFVLIQTMYNNSFSRIKKIGITGLMLFFLFQLLARNAIFTTALFFLFEIFKTFKIKKLLLFLFFVALFALLIFKHPHPYLKEKFIDRINLFDENNQDQRIMRHQASLNVFKKSPIIGVGPKNDDELRVKEYERLGFTTAAKNNFNSHNQFIEFLVSSGLIGFIIFTLALFKLVSISVFLKERMHVLIMTAFIFACLTESILERSLGIKYFSVIATIVLVKRLQAANYLKLDEGSQ